MVNKKISINTEFIKLDSLLKLIGEGSTGGQAKLMIQNKEVLLNGEICTLRGKKIYPGDVVMINGNFYSVEAGEK